MLNELYQLAGTLEKQQVLSEMQTQRDIHKVAKCQCLYIRLDQAGMPQYVKILSPQKTGILWKHSKGNHNSFPAIRVQKPLLAESVSRSFNEAAWKKADVQEKGKLFSALEDTANPDSQEITVKKWTLEQMVPVLQSDDSDLEALRRLLLRFPQEYSADFYSALRKAVKENLTDLFTSAENAEFLKKLFVGAGDMKKGKYTAGCMCYFDIAETEEVDCIVASLDTEQALIRCLLTKPEEASNAAALGISALSGANCPLISDKYPNPSFQVLGLVSLFSNNTSAIPCYLRYQLEGAQAFPAGVDEVQQMTDALAFLMDEQRKGKTWNSFPGIVKKKPMLLLAWLEDDPSCDAKLAQSLSDDGQIKIYESICKNVLDYLKLKVESAPDKAVHLQLFETLDAGRKQIAYANVLTAQQVYVDMLEWCESAKNLPRILFAVKFKSKDGREVRWYRPHCPGPGAVWRLLHIQYCFQQGMADGVDTFVRDVTSELPTLHQIYRLLLPHTENQQTDCAFVQKFLHQTLTVVSGLLVDAGGFQTTQFKQPFSQKNMEKLCAAVSLLGILLYKCQIKKENYMESQAFLLGRFLKLADQLHKEYCIVVRNGGDKTQPLPNQLMGNAVFMIALQNPVEALNHLEEKMRIYIGWAEREADCKTLKQFEKVSAELHRQTTLPQKLSAEERAQLLLGYLAQLPDDSADKSNQEEDA